MPTAGWPGKEGQPTAYSPAWLRALRVLTSRYASFQMLGVRTGQCHHVLARKVWFESRFWVATWQGLSLLPDAPKRVHI